MTAQVAADLRAAADVLERDGWTQGTYHDVIDGRVCHCAQGALAVVVTGSQHVVPDSGMDDDELYRWELANSALAKWLTLHREYESYVPDWNDEPGRTAAEVIAALRAAADRAETAL